MLIAIHQPEYMPWLGFFDKLNKADLFVIFDDVQFQEREFINRNKIRTSTDWQWLTVPIIHKYHRENINVVPINNLSDWRKKHWKSLQYSYGSTAHFKEQSVWLKNTFAKDWDLLANLNIHIIKNFVKILKIKTPLQISSALNVRGKGTDRLINICKAVGANSYLSGEGGKRYMELDKFEDANIGVTFREFKHPIYPQYSNDFQSNLSIIDALSYCGSKEIRKMLNIK